MKRMISVSLWIVLTGLVLCGAANATEIRVTESIALSERWTADNVYNLQNQIYVLPGATLTIDAGTLVQSTAGVGGSLAVCRGAKIYVNGTANNPVVMTSTSDTLKTWHEGANEWGNLTIMGDALISASHYGGEQVASNTKEPTGLNQKQMEGLVAVVPGDPNVMYGGADDEDDSGSIAYLSLRYGGKVIGLANELNGLSLGGIGRATDIHHVEIMNNVDDGIEIWGGTVNLKYLNIWNIGDDSLDADEGWRGKAQFGLIVQGHSADASQGSGVGDNCFETDGAEDSDAQPVTTAAIYNFTVVGQPIEGDGGTTWRDNARVQYRNCIFMDLGEKLVRFDGDDGDGASGYGYNGTLSWQETWNTPYTQTSTVNVGTFTPDAFNDPSVMYQAQTSGMLAEITGCVFYNNNHADAYTEADARGVTVSGGSNPAKNNIVAVASPITSITRGLPVEKGGKTMLPVTYINPCATNDALVNATAAPNDGFFTPVQYRGGFNADYNWLMGWTAAYDYGMADTTRVAIRDLTNQFYLNVLGREPEAGAVEAWEKGYFDAAAMEVDVRFILREMGRLFFLSEEYEGRERSDAEFIQDCYETFLLRTPNTAELSAWTEDIDPKTGEVRWNRSQVMTMFAESEEFADLVVSLFPGKSGIPTRNFVNTMYIGIFDRLVDSAGLEFFAAQVDAAAGIEGKRALAKTMAADFFNSEEGQAKAPDNYTRVVRLYRAFLGRFPGDHEYGYWVSELDGGNRTLADLIGLFGDADEFTTILNRYF